MSDFRLEYSRRSRTELFVLQTEFSFSVRSIERSVLVALATRPIVMSKKTTEKLNLCLLLGHYLAHRGRQQRGLHTTSFKDCVCLITNASQTRHESQTHPRMVRWWCIRLTTDFSGWQSIIAFPRLFLVSSRLRLTFLLSPNRQNEKLNFGLPIETQSRILARLSRSTRQHPGHRQSLSLSFCSAIDLEAQFDQTWRRTCN